MNQELIPILNFYRPILDDLADKTYEAWTKTGRRVFDLKVSPDANQQIVDAMNAYGGHKEKIAGVTSLAFHYGTLNIAVEDDLPEGSYIIQ